MASCFENKHLGCTKSFYKQQEPIIQPLFNSIGFISINGYWVG